MDRQALFAVLQGLEFFTVLGLGVLTFIIVAALGCFTVALIETVRESLERRRRRAIHARGMLEP